MDDFFARYLAGHPLIGVHARGTDATSSQELRAFRQGSLVLSRYVAEIERLLDVQPRARIFVATDEQGRQVGQVRVKATPEGHLRALGWAGQWPERRWASQRPRRRPGTRSRATT